VTSLPHGGRLSEARRLFPDAPEPWLDLSTGINPQPYPVPTLGNEHFARLPDPEQLQLLQTAATAAYGVADPSMVVAAPGTQILIELLPRLWPVASVGVLCPTYTEHLHVWRKAGVPAREVASLDALGGADVAVVCNPNNPDGRRHHVDRMLALADMLARRGGFLVVDEAFADLEDDDLSLASALPHAAVIALRSFGKTYGLAGLRLGFALTAPARAAQIRGALGPWAVSGPAIAIGVRALSDQRWLAATAERLKLATRAMDECLLNNGLSVIGGTRLFRLVESANAPAVFSRLGRAGIFVRRFADHPRWLRFGQPGSRAEMERLRAALRA
jgi:cobalamin biosynthesis protein CobC